MNCPRLISGVTFRSDLRARLMSQVAALYRYDTVSDIRSYFYDHLLGWRFSDVIGWQMGRPHYHHPSPCHPSPYQPSSRLPVRREFDEHLLGRSPTLSMRRACRAAGMMQHHGEMLAGLRPSGRPAERLHLALMGPVTGSDGWFVPFSIYRALIPSTARWAVVPARRRPTTPYLPKVPQNLHWIALSFRDGVPIDLYPRLPLLPRGPGRQLYRLHTTLNDSLERACRLLGTIRIRP